VRCSRHRDGGQHVERDVVRVGARREPCRETIAVLVHVPACRPECPLDVVLARPGEIVQADPQHRVPTGTGRDEHPVPAVRRIDRGHHVDLVLQRPPPQRHDHARQDADGIEVVQVDRERPTRGVGWRIRGHGPSLARGG
jgi:hypothetical protein